MTKNIVKIYIGKGNQGFVQDFLQGEIQALTDSKLFKMHALFITINVYVSIKTKRLVHNDVASQIY